MQTVPDADTVFRIASMTKSFTAATVLLLRDEGRLHLDDPVAMHVPELQGQRPPIAGAPAITLRRLLSMSAGFPGDDPWGDRQQDLAHDAFSEFLEGGQSFAFIPGTAFEYSNLGYAILGRVITNVTGQEYRDVVRARVLEPLGMTSTGYEAAGFPAERLATGYVRRDDTFVEEPFVGYGAFAAMGGLFSTVRDLAGWVDGFARAYAPRGDDLHPISRASRLEMQQVHRMIEPELTWTSIAELPTAATVGYGFGRSCDRTWNSARSSRTAAATRGSARTCDGIPRRAWASWCWATGRTSPRSRSASRCCGGWYAPKRPRSVA